jgi:hypothetical protein
MLGRGGNPKSESSSDGVITAPSWKGPYTMHGEVGDPVSSPAVEDPFVYQVRCRGQHVTVNATATATVTVTRDRSSDRNT